MLVLDWSSFVVGFVAGVVVLLAVIGTYLLYDLATFDDPFRKDDYHGKENQG
jgi:hypothetical protein